MFPIFAAFGQTFMMLLLGGVATFLILLVLVQRGRGGGLAGALGGMGGSSAFGAKAGDVFTKITVAAATVWILLCIGATKMAPSNDGPLDVGVSDSAPAEGPSMSAPVDESESPEATDVTTEAPAESAETESASTDAETPAENE